MRKPLALFAAAGLSAGVLAFLGYDNSVFGKDDQQKSADVSGSSSTSGLNSSTSAKGHASLPQGTTKAELSDEAGIRATLRQVTIAAVKDDSLNDLPKYIASTDRDKISKLAQANEQLKPKLQQLRQDFKAKYQEDFAPDEMVFGKSYDTLIIVQGDVVNPALMSNWPVDSSGSSSKTSGGTGSSNLRSDASSGTSGGLSGSSSTSGGGIGASSSSSATGTDRGSSSSSSGISTSTGIQKGFAVAIVTFPPTPVAPEVIVSLVRESGASGGAGASGSSTGTGSSSSSSPRSDAGSTSGAAASPDRFSSSSGTGSATADRSSTSSGTSSGRSGAGAYGQAGASDWKVKLPDNITADQLQQNLTKHIDEVIQMKDKWPTDKTEGYRMVAQHVFEAFYDAGSSTGAGATGAGSSTGTGIGAGDSSKTNRQQ